MRALGMGRRAISLSRSRDRLYVMPTSAGYEIASDGSYRWNGRQRGHSPFSVIQHTISGAGRLHYERQRRVVGAGETMLVTIPHDHQYWVEDGETWEFFWIAMTGREALRLHRAILEAAGPVFRLRPDTIQRLAQTSLDLRDGKAKGAGEASAIAYAATMAIYDDVLGGDGEPRTARPHSIELVLDHIRKRLHEPLEVVTLADVAGLSRSHFSRVFRQCEGVSPAEYIFAYRMRRAASLLVRSEVAVKQVSRDCGFDDPNYFAKAFRKRYGASPTEFRATGMYSAKGS
ncbi:MAG: AraC family transcriptional regulator [Bradyrhizobium sp.]|nr:MAG: AraC family transcriptional regulator [Bradyrhizobium sp.]